MRKNRVLRRKEIFMFPSKSMAEVFPNEVMISRVHVGVLYCWSWREAVGLRSLMLRILLCILCASAPFPLASTALEASESIVEKQRGVHSSTPV
jgi:hypothetical protein